MITNTNQAYTERNDIHKSIILVKKILLHTLYMIIYESESAAVNV